ncbi:MAG: hypothetical protein ACRD2A_02815, partial [Vicinamibacterales bacterium]
MNPESFGWAKPYGLAMLSTKSDNRRLSRRSCDSSEGGPHRMTLEMKLHTLIVLLLTLSLTACRGSSSSADNDPGSPMADSGISELQKVDTKVGTGAEARPGRA